MGETSTFDVSQFISTVSTIFTAAVDWVGDVGTAIAGNPILLVFCALPLVGLGVGLFKRLIRVD